MRRAKGAAHVQRSGEAAEGYSSEELAEGRQPQLFLQRSENSVGDRLAAFRRRIARIKKQRG